MLARLVVLLGCALHAQALDALCDLDPAVRVRAVRELAQRGDPVAVMDFALAMLPRGRRGFSSGGRSCTGPCGLWGQVPWPDELTREAWRSPLQLSPAARASDADLAFCESPSQLAIYALGCMGERARVVADRLIEHACSGADEGEQAVHSLAWIGAAAHARIVAGWAKRPRTLARALAFSGLAAAMPLARLVSDPRTAQREWAIQALAEVKDGPGADLALPALIALLDGEDARLCAFAAQALVAFRRQALSALTSTLRDGSRARRRNALAVLALIGPDAACAVDDVVRALDPREPPVTLFAAHALWSFRLRDVDAERAARALMPLLYDESISSPCWFVVANALGSLGPAGARAIPALREGLTTGSPLVQLGSLEALGRLGPLARAALCEIEPFQHERDLDLCSAARGAIESIRGER